jgi:hypothetical protein
VLFKEWKMRVLEILEREAIETGELVMEIEE